jgi:nuclear protein localization family protein 4
VVGLSRCIHRCGLLHTGDSENNIHFEGYQVSNQCMALVRDDCLIPTRDAPELGYVKESSNEQYVPDVFYKVNTCYSTEQFLFM